MPLLEDKGITVSAVGEVKVSDHLALGVKVSANGHRDVVLYFDKETALLVKSVHFGERVYSNYKTTDGLKWPMKMVDYTSDGKQFREFEIMELKFLENIDESEFAKP